MADRKFELIQLDVFTQTKLAGNQLAVFTDARGLSDAEMQALAKEMNLSETTFILPRDAEAEKRNGVTVRIFTVEEELPFAGHPSLGTALCLRTLRGPAVADEITLDLKIGKIPVRFTAQPDGSVFGEMRQCNPEFGAELPRQEVARTIGIPADELSPDWPVQIVSTGLPFAIVPLRKLETLTTLKFAFHQAEELLGRTRARFFYFLHPYRENGKLQARARMIFYNGEDPATGSAAGCAAAWMVRHGVAQTDEQVLIRQGVETHRPSDIYVRAARADDSVTNVRVGGYAVEVMRAAISL